MALETNTFRFTVWVLLMALFVQVFFDPLGTGRVVDDLQDTYLKNNTETESSTVQHYKKLAFVRCQTIPIPFCLTSPQPRNLRSTTSFPSCCCWSSCHLVPIFTPSFSFP